MINLKCTAQENCRHVGNGFRNQRTQFLNNFYLFQGSKITNNTIFTIILSASTTARGSGDNGRVFIHHARDCSIHSLLKQRPQKSSLDRTLSIITSHCCYTLCQCGKTEILGINNKDIVSGHWIPKVPSRKRIRKIYLC